MGALVAFGDLMQEEVAGFQTHRRAEEELAGVFAGDFQGYVKMAPLILGFLPAPTHSSGVKTFAATR
jgi:hypothetical protein